MTLSRRDRAAMVLALELVRRGMGWTVVDFLTAQHLDPRTMVALELHELSPMSLYSYHSPNRRNSTVYLLLGSGWTNDSGNHQPVSRNI
mgnify:CR=1 FL=1